VPVRRASAVPASVPLRARLRGGERLLGTFVKSRDPLIAEALASAGYDLLFADLEHSALSPGDIEGIVRACDAYGVPVVVRLPPAALGLCGQLLDSGVTGIQVSDVTSAADAAAARAAVCYPPAGARSLSLSTRAARFGAVPAGEHLAVSQQSTVLTGQIESAAGVAAICEILASDVFDGLFIGPTDLSVSVGRPGDAAHPDVTGPLETAIAATLGHGTPLGIFCGSAQEAQRWADRGLTLLAISSDLTMIASAARSALGRLRPSDS